jgi:hypothetical protein
MRLLIFMWARDAGNTTVDKLRITLGNRTMARYPEGGGHWTVRLQYMLGLKALGHDATLLELLWSSGEKENDDQLIKTFFERMRQYDIHEQCALILFPKGLEEHDIRFASFYGKTEQQVKDIIADTDLFINDCGRTHQPLLGMFARRAYLDLDPGHIHLSAATFDFKFDDHHFFWSVGKKLHDPDCLVPTLGRTWHTFFPFVYLPMWKVAPDPGPRAPFSTITHWTWAQLVHEGRIMSISKRDAYLRYLELPQRLKRPFELAANIKPDDHTGDRELLDSHGWKRIDPWEVAGSPSAYQQYIASSRAEIMCPKPVFRELKTGWFSDRSSCYLASGRPVLAEDTGFSDYLPTGSGLLAFRDLDEAIAGVAEIDANYPQHMRAARALAEEHLDSGRGLGAMLASCGY